ncbi:LOW QUALITY PROTEIN: histone deacetylase 8 [Procambarus clarkii]|uniref:LOW QUALITY PROTEIN: histone deacetylase 8 n=1 Tax=Procambarus clarkii TaxID=6728 RepID=UPI003742504D
MRARTRERFIVDTMSTKDIPKVAYITDSKLICCCDAIPVLKRRASLTHHLIAAYGLVGKMNVIPSQPATEDDVRGFHSEDYVKFLEVAKPDGQELNEDEFGLGFDCPILNNLWTIVCQVAGASLTAALALTSSYSTIAINWCGGWHHAQRDSASGFCYVNDIVLAVRHLRTKFDKILYIDLDIHHGDGVENAFLFSPKVVTLSFHQLETGFFPGTGEQKDVGLGKGRYYSFNVPYKAGINNKQFVYLFESILYNLCEVYMPNAVVCQCGADAVSGDPLGGGNLTPEAFKSCVRHILNLHKPTLFLGGGGYDNINTAKLWTVITSTILDTPLSAEIPEHQFFPLYGPSFELEVTAGLRKSENTQKSLDETVWAAHENIKKLAELLGKKAS